MTALFWHTEVSEIAQCDFRDTLSAVAAFGGCDLVLTSPPYDDARTYGNDVSWRFGDYQSLGDHVARALKPGGWCLMVIDGPVREWRPGFGTERSFTPWRVLLDWTHRVGLRAPDRLAYGRQGHPGRYEGRFRNDWEPLLWFQRVGGEGFFDKDPISWRSPYGTKAGKATGRRPDGTMYGREASGEAMEQGVTRRGTLWWYGNVGHGHDDPNDHDHPARFTSAFAEDAVRCFCPPGGVVVDPFVGSGTSAVAAVRHGRRFGGGDLFASKQGKPWALVAHERVVQEIQQGSTRGRSPANVN